MALNSPNLWIFDEDDLRSTPSRADGISFDEEMYQRAHGVDLIVRVGSIRIAMPALTIATASVFLHRFYMMHSLKQYGSREVAMACLFLAGKVEESLRKVEAVVNYLLRLEDRRKGKEPDVHPTSEPFRRLVQQVLYVEEVVLVALQFDMTVEHPYPILTRAVKRFDQSQTTTPLSLSLDGRQMNALGRASWQILTDLYTTPLCICYPPAILAAAAFLLAWQDLQDVLPLLPKDWTAGFDTPIHEATVKESTVLIDWSDAEEVAEIDAVTTRILDFWAKSRSEKTTKNAARLRSKMVRAVDYVIASTSKEENMAGDRTDVGASTVSSAVKHEEDQSPIRLDVKSEDDDRLPTPG